MMLRSGFDPDMQSRGLRFGVYFMLQGGESAFGCDGFGRTLGETDEPGRDTKQNNNAG